MKQNLIQELSFNFALQIIELYKRMQSQNEYIISKQVLRSGTSIGANVEEAIAGISKKDCIAKLSISSKEARETKYWLRLLKESNLVDIDVSNELKSIESIINVLTKIIKTSQGN